MTEKFNNEFKNILESQLLFFDELLAKSQAPLSIRPFAAACYFVDYCIVKIVGDNKENYLEKEWFKSIFKLTKQWYKDRYANAFKVRSDYFAIGVVLIYHTPFQLKIPLSIAQEQEGDDKRWFCLPNSVLENENVFDWIINKPNLTDMSEDELNALKKMISDISISTRSINVNLMSASFEKEFHKISNSIPGHLDKAVRDILSLDASRIATSYWEIHLAIEKCLKSIILQNGSSHGNKHNLFELCEIVNNIKEINLDCNIFSKFPSDKEAIRQRYGEGRSFTIHDAVTNFINANKVISKLTKLFRRQIIMKNASFLIQLPPWAK